MHLKIRDLHAANSSLLKSCLSIKRRKERYGGRLASASSEVGKREETTPSRRITGLEGNRVTPYLTLSHGGGTCTTRVKRRPSLSALPC